MVARIYANIGRPLLPGPAAPPALPGAYTVAFDRDIQKGGIRVAQAEAGPWPELHRAAVDLAEIAGAKGSACRKAGQGLPRCHPTSPRQPAGLTRT
ncbi:MAG: hypothetical protein ACP59X_12920 [Solidesulfovibrio sp. DCME]|uniref:hypothetical protein n=1 Tax=Solidesulfovibrio sp. DCME TaxID=3447380 RepID=UPI003D0DDB4C